MNAVGRIAQRGSFAFLLLILLAAPLPLGSYRDWSWSPLGVAVGLIGLLQLAGTLWSNREDWVPSGSLLPCALAIVAVTLWALLQTVALPLRDLSNPIVDQAYASLGLAAPGRIAVRPDATFTSVMMWLTYAVTFWVVVHVARDPRRAKQILTVLVVAGVGVTLYSLLADAAAGLKGDFAVMVPKVGSDGFSGTFFNKNSYATYAGLCVLAALTLIRTVMPSGRQSDLPLNVRIHRLMQSGGGTLGLCGAALIFLIGGLVLSGSRAGLGSFICGLGAMWLLGRRRSLITIAIGILLGLVLFFLAGGVQMFLRFLLLGNDFGERPLLYNVALDWISQRPWSGWGLGSFQSLYSIMQPASVQMYFDKTHDTYLELLLDLGIPFGLVLPLVVLSLAARCAWGLRERARHQEFPAVAISATVLVGIHSMFDFSLQIPAVALTYTVLLAIGWTQSWSSRQPEGLRRRGGARTGKPRQDAAVQAGEV